MDESEQAEKETRPTFSIFYSYARPDKDLRDKLESHLALLRRMGLITGWYDRSITGGKCGRGRLASTWRVRRLSSC
jgi:hypothetical protein